MPGLISCAGVTRDGDCYASVNICTMHVEHGYQMLRVEHKLNTCIHHIHMHAVHAIVHCTSLFPTPTVMCVPSDLNCWSWIRVWTPSLEKWWRVLQPWEQGLLPDCRVGVKESKNEDDSRWMRWQHTQQLTFWTMVSLTIEWQAWQAAGCMLASGTRLAWPLIHSRNSLLHSS